MEANDENFVAQRAAGGRDRCGSLVNDSAAFFLVAVLCKPRARNGCLLLCCIVFLLGLYIQHAQNPERVVQSAVFLSRRVGDYFFGSVKNCVTRTLDPVP